MNSSLWKPWLITTFTIAVAGIVIRAIWQIVVIPTTDSMIIFIPLIIALIGANALVAYTVIRPEHLTSVFSLTTIALVLTAGLIAGVVHFINFILSPLTRSGVK